ncbi:unnamed protein product [Ceratitis capitata]|uniref:(Mediterranean fruit fly) hypothetical protein n=1 Tax=Ceratitis capitata TaxID=7213 RepID=A0A811UR32_CERCA|nr:unnamed protein product [Ceratitis capitata]
MTDIIAFSTMVNNLTAFLENAGAASHLTNPTLLDGQISKLPMNKREEWARYIFSANICFPSIRNFSNWLQEIAIFISIAADVMPVKSSNTNEQLSLKSNKAVKSVLVVTEKKCSFCKNSHNLNQCQQFKDLECSERWKFAKSNHLCFSCLRSGHNSTNCNSRRECGINSCHRSHNRLLHEQDKKVSVGSPRLSSNVANVRKPTADSSNVTTIFQKEMNKKILFKFLPVEIKGPLGSCKLIAFIDDDSKISLIEEQLAKAIGLKGPIDELSLRWIGGKTSRELSQRLDVEISGVNKNARSFQMKNIRTTTKLELPAQMLILNTFISKYARLQNLPIDDYVDSVLSAPSGSYKSRRLFFCPQAKLRMHVVRIK